MSPILVQDRKMSDVALIRECAAPIMPGESVKAQINRAARRLGWAYWRTYNAWYSKVSLSAEEREQARAVMLKNTRNLEAIHGEFERGLQIVLDAAAAFAAASPSGIGARLDELKRLAGESGPSDLARRAGEA